MGETRIRNMDEFSAVCGISRPTLSKYFNNPDSVRAKTREKIEQALDQHDYRPNIYAMNQNRRRTKNVGIVVPYLADPFFNEIGRAVELACIDAGYRPILLSSHGDVSQEIENLDALKALKPAGVLLAPIGRSSEKTVIQRFGRDVPLVLFDANIEDTGEAFIGTDHFQSVDLIVEYLCRSGEPPCFFEMKTPSNPNALKRRQAYLESMEQHGFAPHIFQAEGEGWNFEEIGCEEGGRMLAKRVFPTRTILCSNDRLAIGLLSAAYKQKISIGHEQGCDLRIAGHDDHPFARYTCPSLTTIAQDYAAIAECAATWLFSRLDAGDSPSERVETLFTGNLIMRSSA